MGEPRADAGARTPRRCVKRQADKGADFTM